MTMTTATPVFVEITLPVHVAALELIAQVDAGLCTEAGIRNELEALVSRYGTPVSADPKHPALLTGVSANMRAAHGPWCECGPCCHINGAAHTLAGMDGWGRPLMQAGDGHGWWDCNNYDCTQHPSSHYGRDDA